jgi:hypothetical protein
MINGATFLKSVHPATLSITLDFLHGLSKMSYMTNLYIPATDDLYAAQDSFLKVVFHLRKELVGDLDLILAGGTALARYYLNHRVSYDLDFFVAGDFHPERLKSRLERQGLRLSEVGTVLPGGAYAAQLHGYAQTELGYPVKISFVEDFLAGAFQTVAVGQGVLTEEVNGLYHRKLRTITGAGPGETATGAPANLGCRQTARDVFDLFVLSKEVRSLWEFVDEINEHGANLPEDALLRGLHLLPWKQLMDEFDQLERLKYTDIALFDIKRHFDENYRISPGRR